MSGDIPGSSIGTVQVVAGLHSRTTALATRSPDTISLPLLTPNHRAQKVWNRSSLPTFLKNVADGQRLNLREAAVERLFLWQIEVASDCPAAKCSKDGLELLLGHYGIYGRMRWKLCNLEGSQLVLVVVCDVELDACGTHKH